MIDDRRFELRVHSFLWIPQDEWRLHKRLGPADQIAWNFHQGGHFQTVRHPDKYKVFTEAREIARKILEMRKMAFGAVDLIVDNNMEVYFIEVNASPGFTELSQGIYVDAINRLVELPVKEIKKYGRI
jgi:glutathione synthase/RimK-type ligase-like ATP-grasp enzyme